KDDPRRLYARRASPLGFRAFRRSTAPSQPERREPLSGTGCLFAPPIHDRDPDLSAAPLAVFGNRLAAPPSIDWLLAGRLLARRRRLRVLRGPRRRGRLPSCPSGAQWHGACPLLAAA